MVFTTLCTTTIRCHCSSLSLCLSTSVWPANTERTSLCVYVLLLLPCSKQQTLCSDQKKQQKTHRNVLFRGRVRSYTCTVPRIGMCLSVRESVCENVCESVYSVSMYNVKKKYKFIVFVVCSLDVRYGVGSVGRSVVCCLFIQELNLIRIALNFDAFVSFVRFIFHFFFSFFISSTSKFDE